MRVYQRNQHKTTRLLWMARLHQVAPENKECTEDYLHRATLTWGYVEVVWEKEFHFTWYFIWDTEKCISLHSSLPPVIKQHCCFSPPMKKHKLNRQKQGTKAQWASSRKPNQSEQYPISSQGRNISSPNFNPIMNPNFNPIMKSIPSWFTNFKQLNYFTWQA